MNEYWRQREEQAQREYELTEEQYIAELNSIYDYMLDQVKKEINGFYSKYAAQEGITMAEAQQRTSQLDIEEYERKAQKYVEEKNFSAQANSEMRLYNLTMRVNRLQLLEANIGLETVSGFDELNEKLGEDLSERAVQEMRRQAGILGKTVQDNAKKANSIVGASFHNAKFSDRIWMYQAQLRDELDSLLRNGLIQGWNPNEMARHIDKLFDTGKYNCERLMRTELTRVQSDAQLESFTANGFNEYQFNALGDACRICAALDEKHFKISEAMPGENLPPIHPNCRCAVSAWMDDALYQQWLDSYANHGMSFEDWLNNRPTAVEPGTSELDACKTVQDVEDLLKSKNWMLREEFEGDVFDYNSKIKLDGLDLESAKAVYSAYEALFDKYPQLVGQLHGVTTKNFRDWSRSAETGFDGIILNTQFFSDSERFNSDYAEWVEMKKSPSGTTGVMGTIFHELGHEIDYYLTGADEILFSKNTKWTSGSLRPKVMKACGLKVNENTITDSVSIYATKNSQEWFAEAFAEYMESDSPRAVASELGRQLDELLREAQ